MSPLNFTRVLIQAVDELSESESYKGLFHQHTDGHPLPPAKASCDIIEPARATIFPRYFERNDRRQYPDRGELTIKQQLNSK